jgi:hypothetical protein
MHIADTENLLQIYDHQGELQVRLDDVVDADRRRGAVTWPYSARSDKAWASILSF